MDAAWIALIGTLFGGSAFKIIEHMLGRTKTRDDTATTIRTELRGEVGTLRADNETLRDEVDEWRSKYYELVSVIASGDVAAAKDLISEHRK